MRKLITVVGLAFGLVAMAAGPAWAITTERASVDAAGNEGLAPSQDPDTNTDGRFVVFETEAALDPADTNGLQDIYLKDMVTGGLRWVSQKVGGGDSNGHSHDPAISADGLFVAYASDATDLVPVDPNGLRDVFVHNVTTGATQVASVGPGGIPANGPSNHPKISAAPNPVVVFDSTATNLAPNDVNAFDDVYARVLASGANRLISRTPGGVSGNGPSTYPDITPNASRIAYESRAFDLAPDANGPISDVLVHQPATGVNLVVSVASNGAVGNGDSGRPDLSTAGNGRFVVFHSDASSLVAFDANNRRDVFWRDIAAGNTRIVSGSGAGQGNDHSQNPSVDPDGVWVAYESTAANLVPGDTNGFRDVFLREMTSAFVGRISVNSSGGQADGPSSTPATAANGGSPRVAYDSLATNLAPGDANGVSDVFRFRP